MANLDSVIQTLKSEESRLKKQLEGISAALKAFGSTHRNGRVPRGKMSAEGRARIAAAQRARWAKARGNEQKSNAVTKPKKRTLSPAARKRIAAAQRARWAKVKSTQKKAAAK